MTMNQFGKFFGAVLAGLMISFGAHAGMITTEGLEPWEICGLCHNLDGISAMPKFPKLAGQRPAYIVKQFHDFHDMRRENDSGQMQAITTEIDLDDLDEIAAYFSALPAPPPIAEDDELAVDRGKKLFENGGGDVPACAGCHDVGTVEGLDTPAPWLQAQHRDYLIKELTDFQAGRRQNDPLGIMQHIAGQLADEEIVALARYLASTERPQKEQ